MAVQGDGLGGNYFELDGIVFLKSCWHCVYSGENGEYSITLLTCALLMWNGFGVLGGELHTTGD